LTLVALLVVSTLVTRVAAALLMSSGLSPSFARFQARSAFTGVGFTTTEAETVVNHPFRRKVVGTLMLLGNLGIGAVIASLVISFQGAGPIGSLRRTLVLILAGLVMVVVARTATFERWLVRVTRRLLALRLGTDTPDRATLAHLGADHDVIELAVRPDDWVAGRPLGELRLRDEGVMVLGVERKGEYHSLPDRDTRIEPGDVIVLYGRRATLEGLDVRRAGPAGELHHVDEVVEQRRRERDEPEATGPGADGDAGDDTG
jgi:hypothetical protein